MGWMMGWFVDQFFGGRLNQETEARLNELALASACPYANGVEEGVKRLGLGEGPKLTMGTTLTGDAVMMPLGSLVKAHALVTGGTGAGKTMFTAVLLRALLEEALLRKTIGVGVLDAKGDLFRIGLFFLHEILDGSRDLRADAVRSRVRIIDFSRRDPISPYNLFAPWPDADLESFAWHRVDVLSDQLQRGDDLSQAAVSLWHKLIMLQAEFGLPPDQLHKIIHDADFRTGLIQRCQNPYLIEYFRRDFPAVLKSTLGAIERRSESLFSSAAVRLVSGAPTAPDFRRDQDEGQVVLATTFATDTSAMMQERLRELIFSDIARSVFTRRQPEKPFLWICDEAQTFFATGRQRANMAQLLTMSRSFGSHFLFVTQHLASAVRDAMMLDTLRTNIRWAFAMRGEPSDCAFMKPFLPVTGRRPKPRLNPFEEPQYYTLAEERGIVHEEIASLPDRVGWLWVKAIGEQAVKIKTPDAETPPGPRLQQAVQSILADPSIGMRLSGADYAREARERDRASNTRDDQELHSALSVNYRRTRGGTRSDETEPDRV
jgi:uncharacterized protein DUF87